MMEKHFIYELQFPCLGAPLTDIRIEATETAWATILRGRSAYDDIKLLTRP